MTLSRISLGWALTWKQGAPYILLLHLHVLHEVYQEDAVGRHAVNA